MNFEVFPMRSESDQASVIRLWRDNLGDSRIRGAIDTRWRWLNEDNPAGPVRMFVVAMSGTGTVVGAGGALPRTLWVRGQELRAAVLCDFVVDKSHRVAGPAVALQRTIAKTCFEEGFDLLYGFPNERAFPVVARVGYKTVSTATMWFRPLQASQKLRKYVPGLIARGAGFVVDSALRAHEFQLHWRRKRGFEDTLCRHPDSSFLDLWDRTRGILPIAGERTPAYLGWRYARHPIDQCGFFCLRETAGDRLRAYVAYSVLDGKVNVLDVFWDRRDVIECLFLEFVRRMRALGYASITVCHAGDDDVVLPLRYLGFVQSKQQRRFICKVRDGQDSQIEKTTYDALQWSLFDGELDI